MCILSACDLKVNHGWRKAIVRDLAKEVMPVVGGIGIDNPVWNSVRRSDQARNNKKTTKTKKRVETTQKKDLKQRSALCEEEDFRVEKENPDHKDSALSQSNQEDIFVVLVLIRLL